MKTFAEQMAEQAKKQANTPALPVSAGGTPRYAPAPPSNYNEPVITVRVEVNTGASGGDRIDLYFSRKPTDQTIANLRAADFRAKQDSRGDWFWYHRDCPENRRFCEVNFGADFSDIDAPSTPAAKPEIVVSDDVTIQGAKLADAAKAELPGINAFARYKEQCAQLQAELKVDGADLAILAVACLHKQTFGEVQ